MPEPVTHESEAEADASATEPRLARPVRKDETILHDRGLYVERWLPERRSRRRPLFLIHGELGGSWVWENYLSYFAQRGWEGHALNLRAHFWSDTADLASLDFWSYLDDVGSGLAALDRPAVLVGHGMGALLALKAAERVGAAGDAAGLVLLSPAMPQSVAQQAPSHVVRLVPPVFRGGLIGWDGALEPIVKRDADLTMADARRIQHLMGAESGAARRQMLEGVPIDRTALGDIPMLVVGAGLDNHFPETESLALAGWLGAEYQPFHGHSHFGLVVGEQSHEQVADAVRAFLEAHRL